MRRIDDGHAARPPPFRVLPVPDGSYLTPGIPPPPPRAPEPYKVVPSSTSFSRAHRRSSFVIIADSRPTTPESRSPSPILNVGRASPFRGRGFKGPPPRSKSRPQSPEVEPRKRIRNDRRASVSQQNSPRRSLIPQPTRQRSTSLTKTNERQSSPKIGRRVDSRNRLNLSDSKNRLNASNNSNSATNLSTRRQPTKPFTRLSPIQGTPTKPEKSTVQLAKRDRSREAERPSMAKTPRYSGSPSKTVSNARRPNQENGSGASKDRLASPSKIPLKASRNGTSGLNPARFITIPNSNQLSEKTGRKSEKGPREGKIERPAKESGTDVTQPEGSSKGSQSNGRNSGSEKAGEVDLIHLLKQTSGATGTSSVVNTTTTTAAQPLQIDSHPGSVEKDSEKKGSVERRNGQQEQPRDQVVAVNSRSSNSPLSNGDAKQGLANGHEDITQRGSNPPTSGKTSKSGGNYNRTRAAPESKNDSPVPDSGDNNKTSNGAVSGKMNRSNGPLPASGSATQRANRAHQAATVDQSNRNVRPSDQKVERAEEASSVRPASVSDKNRSNSAASQATKPAETETPGDQNKASDKGSAAVNPEKIPPLENASSKAAESRVPSKPAEAEGKGAAIAGPGAATGQVTSSRTNHANSCAVNDPRNVSEPAGVNDLRNVSDSQNVSSARVRNENRDSNASLKSSGVSTDSIESVRSTDTGVSVNTVRGVSSPREKTGMHLVKRPQEIETLSGNVMHLEQNGEPTLLAEANGAEVEQPPERFLTRWKRSATRFCGCCPSMRCLACRADSKKLSWPRSQGRTTSAGNEDTSQLPPEAAAESMQTGCWGKVKGGCRCNRLKTIKCCLRGSKIAPAEAAVCCPPERRFGAICRRLFDRCKCKRAEAERTRSIRAKHSLTSVAPPPLSEEPKAKIPDVLVEHNSLMRGAIPCLPVPLAWFCLVWNVLLPGSGTVWSGLFNLCTGQPRFSQVAGLKSRLGAFVVNLVVGVGQLFTVLFCLVGWGWSIWWGVTLVRLARKYRRFKASEAANNDPEARAGEPPVLPPGMPSQAFREIERAR